MDPVQYLLFIITHRFILSLLLHLLSTVFSGLQVAPFYIRRCDAKVEISEKMNALVALARVAATMFYQVRKLITAFAKSPVKFLDTLLHGQILLKYNSTLFN